MANLNINRRRCLLLVIAVVVLACISINSFLLALHPGEYESEQVPQVRSKREAKNIDPVDESDFVSDDTDGEQKRFGRRILNESESYYDVGGSRRPIQLKKLQREYYDAKRLYFGKKNCIPRPTTTAPAAGGGIAKSTEAPAEAPAPPPPERRRRGALLITTDRTYYCDEFTTTAAPTTTTTTTQSAGGSGVEESTITLEGIGG